MNRLPRVLFINHSVRDGGPGRSLYYLLKYIDKNKIDSQVLIPKHDVFTDLLKKEGLDGNIIIERKFPENIKRRRLTKHKLFSTNHEENHPSKIVKFLGVLFNLIDLITLVITSPFSSHITKADVIYCNGTQAKIVGTFIGLLNRSPVIWHVRNIQQTKILWTTINLLSMLPVVKRIICVSNAAADQFRYSKNKITVVHNGIDLDDYNPKRISGVLRNEYDIPNDVVIVGSTGRIVPRKGYEYFVKAASIVCKNLRGISRKVKFVVVGDTPHFFLNNHLESIKRLVKEQELEEFFIFTGYKQDIRPYLKDFDIFVIPSNYPDPFPRTVIEASSFALPVVGFRIGGMVESVAHDETGMLCDPGNEKQMSESILRLIQSNSLRESMGVAGRVRANKLFSAKDISKRVEENILEVIQQNR